MGKVPNMDKSSTDTAFDPRIFKLPTCHARTRPGVGLAGFLVRVTKSLTRSHRQLTSAAWESACGRPPGLEATGEPESDSTVLPASTVNRTSATRSHGTASHGGPPARRPARRASVTGTVRPVLSDCPANAMMARRPRLDLAMSQCICMPQSHRELPPSHQARGEPGVGPT
jgi:hypothetical protein